MEYEDKEAKLENSVYKVNINFSMVNLAISLKFKTKMVWSIQLKNNCKLI